jgi:hypothetical protein
MPTAQAPQCLMDTVTKTLSVIYGPPGMRGDLLSGHFFKAIDTKLP